MAWSQVPRIYYIIRTNSLGYVNSSELNAGVGLLRSPSAFRNSFKVDVRLERGAELLFAARGGLDSPQTRFDVGPHVEIDARIRLKNNGH